MKKVPVSESDVREMSVGDRLDLIEQIWDSIAAEQDSLPLGSREREELDRRLDEHLKNPDDVIPWERIKAELSGLGLV